MAPTDESAAGWREVVAEAEADGAEDAGDRCLVLGRPLPFEDVLLPFVRTARRRLAARPGGEQLADAAHGALERHLLEQLCDTAAAALHEEFTGLARRHRELAGPYFAALPAGGRGLYEEFVAGWRSGGLQPLFDAYPALAMLLGQAVGYWAAAQGDFLTHLAEDREVIAILSGGDEPGQVVAVRPGLSDPHRGGRAVAALRFDSGLQLIYKPKDLALDEAWWWLLAWLDEQRAPLRPLPPPVIARRGRGWAPLLEPYPCDSPRAARRYFRHAGAVLCLVYVLGGTDFHMENVVACGDQPQLVDLETLVSPALAGAPAHSVLATGLLPTWIPAWGGRVFDVSGLGGTPDQAGIPPQPRWLDVNTDAMRLAWVAGELAAGQHNLPALDGAPLRLAAHVPALLDGFRRTYRFLAARREVLLAPDGPLRHFAGRRVRHVCRGTQEYAAILQHLRAPEFMRDWQARRAALAGLLAPAAAAPALLAAEIEALERQDIPVFQAWNDSRSLDVHDGARLPGFFAEPGFAGVVARVRALGDADLARQEQLIRDSLAPPAAP